jgi:hypothetical protein
VEMEKTQPVRAAFICTRNERQVVVVVRAQGGPALGVIVDGMPVGATDAGGFAHVLVNVDRTVNKIAVGLDTTGNQYLRPKNPSRVFELSGKDTILLFDQTLVQAPRPTRPKVSTKYVPYQIK